VHDLIARDDAHRRPVERPLRWGAARRRPVEPLLRLRAARRRPVEPLLRLRAVCPTALVAAASVVLGCVVLAMASAQASAASIAAPCANTHLRPTRSNVRAVELATRCLIDRERVVHHLRPLHPNRSLQMVAHEQSAGMALDDYFGDDSRTGQTPLQRLVADHYLKHHPSASTAQNIGWGTGRDATPLGMVAAWMDSPPHREIILTAEFRAIGVGVAPHAPTRLAHGERGATYTVELAALKR
jgi:uncharacterized protein YkwD